MFCMWWVKAVFKSAMISKEVVIVTIISEIGAKTEQIVTKKLIIQFYRHLLS